MKWDLPATSRTRSSSCTKARSTKQARPPSCSRHRRRRKCVSSSRHTVNREVLIMSLSSSVRTAALALSLGLGMSLGLSPAMAQTSLDTIIKRGKILIAIDMGSSPYAMTNAQMQPEGSDVEAAQLLAKDLGVELEIVPTTGQGRIPVLLSGKADLTMATFSI